MRLVALDPGKTTGIAVYVDKEGFAPQWRFFQFGPGNPDEQAATPHEVDYHYELAKFLDAIRPEVVVCERFTYQRRELDEGVSLNMDALEYIGVAKAWCQANRVPLVLNTTGSRMWWSDEKLEKLVAKDVFPKHILQHKWRHACDALRHALVHMQFKMDNNTWLMMLKPEPN